MGKKVEVKYKPHKFTPKILKTPCPRCGRNLILSPSGFIRCYNLGCGFGLKTDLNLEDLAKFLKGKQYG